MYGRKVFRLIQEIPINFYCQEVSRELLATKLSRIQFHGNKMSDLLGKRRPLPYLTEEYASEYCHIIKRMVVISFVANCTHNILNVKIGLVCSQGHYFNVPN